MYDKADPESQPLAGYIDGSESEHTCSEEGPLEAPSPAKKSFQNLLFIGIVLFTSAVSGVIGAYLKGHFINLDAKCATYTTHYCKLNLSTLASDALEVT